MTKSELIQSIRQLITDGKTEDAVQLLRENIKEHDESILTDAIILENRYQNAKSDGIIKGIIPREDYDRTIAQINFAILELLEKIEKTTFTASGTAKDKSKGRILHNIPGTMPLNKESRCIVRIAYDDVSLLRDFNKTEDTVVQDVRIAEVMGVELLDFNETPAFKIRTVTGEEQFLASDDYTQWIFQVKPILEGKYPLTLKVSVIEEIDGRERKREIVLEKEVFIINQPDVAVPTAPPSRASISNDKMAFEETNVRLNYTITEDSAAAVPQVATKKRSATAIVSALATVIFAITGLLVYQKSASPKMPDDGIVFEKNDTINVKNSDKGEFADTKSGDKDLEPELKDDDDEASMPAPSPVAVPAPPPPAPIKIKPKGKMATTTKKNNPKILTKPISKKPIPDEQNPAAGETLEKILEASQKKSVDTSNANMSGGGRTYKVNLKLKDEMKDAIILVNGEKPLRVKRNIWGTPQYIEFKTNKKRQVFSFIKDGVTCKVENIEITSENLEIEACSFKKKK
jgi:Effector-associated domain 11